MQNWSLRWHGNTSIKVQFDKLIPIGHVDWSTHVWSEDLNPLWLALRKAKPKKIQSPVRCEMWVVHCPIAQFLTLPFTLTHTVSSYTKAFIIDFSVWHVSEQQIATEHRTRDAIVFGWSLLFRVLYLVRARNYKCGSILPAVFFNIDTIRCRRIAWTLNMNMGMSERYYQYCMCSFVKVFRKHY